jgi:hypothetical protein
LLLTSAAALGAGLIAFPAGAAATPPVVPTCSFPNTTGSDSCVSGRVTAVDGSLGTSFENIRLGTRVRSSFNPATSESTKVIVRYDDAGRQNQTALSAVPTCAASKLLGKNIAQAWATCGPGGGSTKNAYLSTGLGNNVSGIASSTVDPGGVACVMIFKGADNAHVTLYSRAPIANVSTTGCNNPATNTGGSTTILFTGVISRQPTSSPYDYTLTTPNTQAANPALDDFYATVVRGSVYQARCESPLKIQATFFYTAAGDASDTVNGAPQTCP